MKACPNVPVDWEANFFGELWVDIFARLGKFEATDEDCRALIKLLDLQAQAKILDIPCGFGRFSNLLDSLGYQVTGVDSNSFLLDMAKSEKAGVRYINQDMKTPPTGPFDAILNLWTSFGYYPTVDDDLETLKSWYRVLSPGGSLLMEITDLARAKSENFDASSGSSYKIQTHNSVIEEAWFDWEKQEAVISYQLEDRPALLGRTRIYSKDQLCELFSKAGFTSVDTFRGFHQSSTDKSQRLVLIGRKL